LQKQKSQEKPPLNKPQSDSTHNNSSALLDLEDTTTTSNTKKSPTNSLFVVSDHEEQRPSRKSVNTNILLDDSSPQSDFMGITEVSSTTIRRKKGSLISDYDPSTTPPSAMPRHEMEESEKSTHQYDSSRGLADEAQKFTKFLALNSTSSQEGDTKVSQPKSPTLERTDYLQCQQDLDRALWRIRRKSRKSADWYSAASNFCKSIQQQLLLSWIWECLVAACPKESSQNLAERRLGCVLLVEHTSTPCQWEEFASLLAPPPNNQHDNAADSRLLTLGAIVILDHWCLVQQPDSSSPSLPQASTKWMVSLLAHVIPPLAQQILSQQTRTVLAQRAIMTIYNLLATAAEYCEAKTITDPEEILTLQNELWKLCSMYLIPVWEAQLAWNGEETKVAPVDNHESAQSNRVAARRSCINAVLQDWKRTFQALASSNESEDASSKWCKMILGVSVVLENGASLQLGSFRQSLLKAKNKCTLKDIVTFLKEAIRQNDFERKYEATEKQDTMARGIVAWLGQGKQHIAWVLEARHVDGKAGLSSVYEQIHEAASDLLSHAMSERVADLALEIL
jgi:hypothetical protein